MGEAREVEIVRLGAQGDGVASDGDAPLYVPFALPGERWRVGDGGPVMLSPSAERQAAPCRHFGRCGGCMSQHMSAGLYQSWKHGIVVEAFQHRGIAADVLPVVTVKASSRRRAMFGVERRGGDVTIGFREEGQHTLVDLEECLLLDPAIVAAVPGLRDMAHVAMRDREGGRLVVTRVEHGLDVAFENGRRDLSPQERGLLAQMAAALRLVRLTVASDVIVAAGRSLIRIAGVEVELPPAVFLQAVPEAEAVLVELVAAAVPKRAKKAVDLFSGVGTLTFPLARRVSVTAFDSDKRAIGALDQAQRNQQGLKPIEARVRDLFREPLSVRELDLYDVVVFDPPRAGAAEQAERIAKSKVPVVIAVSCNPATLARDARALIDGGYKMGPVTPIDQFLYSPHVEAVAVFRR